MVIQAHAAYIGHAPGRLVILRHDDGRVSYIPRLDWEDDELLGDLDELTEEHGLARYPLDEIMSWLDWHLYDLRMAQWERRG